MFANCVEALDLTLLTDGPEDKKQIEDAVAALDNPHSAAWRVADQAECDDRADTRFAGREKLIEFRRDGHPCWRKITDGLLFGGEDDEAIILDPDLYFPNRFAFEPTPSTGVVLMRQGPNCLFPPEAVRRAMAKNVRLANHVDIGAGQTRIGAIDLDWLDWFVGAIDAMEFKPFMHIEAIVWAALAMRMGGGHYDPKAWRCWQRGHVKRLLFSSGIVKGEQLLKLEPLDKIKCIHVSGPSKWWVVEAEKQGVLKPFDNEYSEPTPLVPYIELTPAHYEREQSMKERMRKLGYYKLTKSE